MFILLYKFNIIFVQKYEHLCSFTLNQRISHDRCIIDWISGYAAHQKALDNESNNIANVNTVGYKAGRISFANQVYQVKIGKG